MTFTYGALITDCDKIRFLIDDTVRPLLQKTSKPYAEVLSKYVIDKYRNVLDFTGLFE